MTHAKEDKEFDMDLRIKLNLPGKLKTKPVQHPAMPALITANTTMFK